MTTLTKTDIINRLEDITRIMDREPKSDAEFATNMASARNKLERLLEDTHKEVYGEADDSATRQSGDVRQSDPRSGTVWDYPTG